MKKKIEKLVVVISIIAFAVSGVSQAQTLENPIPIMVPNFSFELDEFGVQLTENAGDITADSLAWNEVLAGTNFLRPFISTGDTSPYVPDGSSYLMLKDDDRNGETYFSLVWQILDGETMSEGDTYLLTFNTTIYQAAMVGNVVATLIYDDEGTLTEIYGETFVPATAADADEPWDEVSFNFTVPAGAPYIGKDIGIKFEQTMRNWVAVDNVRLEQENIYVSNISPANGETLIEVDVNLEWNLSSTVTNCDVYFGNDSNVDNNPKVVDAQNVEFYDPPGDLDLGTTYYWRIDARVEATLYEGGILEFTTPPAEPVITEDPCDLTVEAGETAVFRVKDVGGVDYTWKRQSDGSSVGGNSSVLTLTNVQKDPCEDFYRCIVENDFDYDESAWAGLWTKRLIARWEFEDDLTDSEADGWDGVYTDPNFANDQPIPVFASGLGGQALQLTADELHVQITGSEEFFNFYPLGYTVSAWVKTEQATDWGCMTSKQDKNNWPDIKGWVLNCTNEGKAAHGLRQVFGDSTGQPIVGTSNIADNQWHMVTATYDAETGIGSIYVDGVLENQLVDTERKAPTNDQPVVFGSEGILAELALYEGLLDKVAIYSYALSADQVATLPGLGAPRVFAGEDQEFSLQDEFLQLDSTVTDDGKPLTDPCDPCSPPIGLTLTWSKVSGPGSVTFDPCSTVEDPCAIFSMVGEYILRLTANDGQYEVHNEVTIMVWNDCNGNGIPDPCDIATGTSTDVNSDGIPDECQPDVRVIPVAVMVDPTTTSEVRTELPDSIENVDPCTTFYLEIWASDVGDENTGLTGVYVDISFDDVLIAQVVEHSTIFTSFTGGTIETGVVDEFGGVSLPHGGGIEPDWVRIGWIEMELKSAVSRCTMELLPSIGGVGAFGRGPVLWEFVELGKVTFTRDCNNNGVPDDIDISEGTSEDCNGNGIPDECDIAEGISEDCNGNGVPDECDIATGTSEDINGDGVPDECQLDVRIEPVVALLDPSTTSEIRNTLPDSLDAVSRGGRYYIEIWASDVGEVNTGLEGVYVDVSFCEQTSTTAVGHGTIFTSDPCGIIQTGKVDEFGGAADPCDVGVEPEWVRVGWIEMTAGVETANCTIALQTSEHGIEANNRGMIPWEVFVELGEVEVAITPPARSYNLYDVDQFINVWDLSLFAVSWLQDVPPGDSAHDFNCDNYVGVGDLSWFATGWLKNTDDPTILYPPCPLGGDSMMFNNMMLFDGYALTGAEDVAFEVVALNNPSASDTTTLLPISIENISNGQTFYIEIWVIDVGDINTGITSAYVDLSFPAEAATVQNISHGGIFTEFATGTTVTGGIDELGGSNLLSGNGVVPDWVRVAIVEMRADAAAPPPTVPFILSASSTGVATWGRDVIDWNDISLGSMTIQNPSDLDGNGRVDLVDFAVLASWWNYEDVCGIPDWCEGADFDQSETVDIIDLAVFVENWL